MTKGSGNSYTADAVSLFEGLNSGTVTITATAKDQAGNQTGIAAVSVMIDKTGPAIRINTPSQAAKTGVTITAGGTAEDGNGAGIDTDEDMVLYYTKSATLGGVTTAPQTITAGTDAETSWVEYETSTPQLDGSDWTVTFTVPDGTAPEDANTDVYFTVSAKDKAGTGNTGYAVPRKITVDRAKPVYDTSYTDLSIGGKTHTEMSSVQWFKDDTLVVKGKFKDEGGSGVTKIFYQVDTKTAVELPTTDGTYNTNISGFGENST